MSDIPYWPHNAKGPIKFVCYSDHEGDTTFTTKENADKLIDLGYEYFHVLRYEFEAGSWVEAMTEHNKREGFNEYVPSEDMSHDK